MRLRVIALDYDGTIAVHGRIHPSLPPALADARERGVFVALVTGRRVADLRDVLEDLGMFDAVVAENGALTLFPATDRSLRHAPPVPAGFVEALHAAGATDAVAGECLVDLDASGAAIALAVIRERELSLSLHFNRSRLMVMPLAVSKATGLREALRMVRLSVHNAVGIGDAENDHELIAACEVGVAVAWGSRALQATADVVLQGEGPSAVASYVREIVRSPRIPVPSHPRRSLVLGRDAGGDPVSLAVRGRNLLITGEPRSGKSWVTGLLCEQLVLHGYSVCIIDPEGDYGPLEALPGVVLLGGDDPVPSLGEITRLLRHADTSVILDLVRMPLPERKRYVVQVLELLARLRRRSGIPHRIVVDEAHYFLHDPDHAHLLDPELAGYTLVTYRVSGLHPTVLDATECVVVTRQRDAEEARVLHDAWRGAGPFDVWQGALATLPLDEAVLLPVTDEAHGALRPFRLASRITQHVRHRHKYLDLGVPESVAFRFVTDDGPGPVARSLAEVVDVLTHARAGSLRGHLERGDLSCWVEEAFGDRTLAERFREIEARARLGLEDDPVMALVHAVEARYGRLSPLGGPRIDR